MNNEKLSDKDLRELAHRLGYQTWRSPEWPGEKGPEVFGHIQEGVKYESGVLRQLQIHDYQTWHIIRKMGEQGYAVQITSVPDISSVQRGTRVTFEKGVYPPTSNDGAESERFSVAVAKSALETLREETED